MPPCLGLPKEEEDSPPGRSGFWRSLGFAFRLRWEEESPAEQILAVIWCSMLYK